MIQTINMPLPKSEINIKIILNTNLKHQIQPNYIFKKIIVLEVIQMESVYVLAGCVNAIPILLL
jgi:hypothetical protein